MGKESPRRIRDHRQAAGLIVAVALLGAPAACVRLARDVDALRQQQAQLAQRVDRLSARLASLTVRLQQTRSDLDRLRALSAQLPTTDASVVELRRRVERLESTLARLQQPVESLAAMPVSAVSPEELFAAAVSAQQRGATDVALALYGQVLQIWPTDEWAIGARVRRAEILQQQGMLLDAMDELLYVMETYPDSPWTADAYLALARGLLVMGRNLEAERLLRDLTMLFPHSAAAAEGARLLAELLTNPAPATAPATISAAVGAQGPETSPTMAADSAPVTRSTVTDAIVAAPPPQ